MAKRRKKKAEKQYPRAGKEDLNAIPVAPGKRAACAPILFSVVSQIDAQLAREHSKQEGLRELYELNASVQAQLRARAK